MPLKCIQEPNVVGLKDVRELEKALAGRRSKWGDLSRLFRKRRPIFVARAPGRLDAMGGIGDYSGAVVCELPLGVAALAAVQPRDDDMLVVHSANGEAEDFTPTVELCLASLRKRKRFKAYAQLQEQLSSDPAASWAAYAIGALPVLQTEGATKGFDRGATIALASDVPLGAGISSSAAIEVATMAAVCAGCCSRMT